MKKIKKKLNNINKNIIKKMIKIIIFYNNMISQLEQYLINSLDNIYHLNCVNHINNCIIAQLGDNGMNNHNLQIGDKVKLYVFYS